jgi:hypothetical protein
MDAELPDPLARTAMMLQLPAGHALIFPWGPIPA